ncbi:unnamed protein product [Leuciscus chuanchicus]
MLIHLKVKPVSLKSLTCPVCVAFGRVVCRPAQGMFRDTLETWEKLPACDSQAKCPDPASHTSCLSDNIRLSEISSHEGSVKLVTSAYYVLLSSRKLSPTFQAGNFVTHAATQSLRNTRWWSSQTWAVTVVKGSREYASALLFLECYIRGWADGWSRLVLAEIQQATAVPEWEGGAGPSAEVWVAQWAALSGAVLLWAPSRDIQMSHAAQLSALRVSSLLSGQLYWPESYVHSIFKPAVCLLDDSKSLLRRQQRAHANSTIVMVSKASADLMHYCSEHAKYDPLLMGIPASENPFKDKKPCTIL